MLRVPGYMRWGRTGKIHYTEINSHFFLFSISRLHLKLNSYSNSKRFFIALLHAHFCFWGHEHLSDILIWKCYPKGWCLSLSLKSSTSRAFHAHNTVFSWLSKNALHERFVAEQWHGVYLSEKAIVHCSTLKKHLAFKYESRFTLSWPMLKHD